MRFSWVLVLLFFSWHSVAVATSSPTIIRHVGAIENNDPQKSFFIHILELACKASEDRYGPCILEQVQIPMFQERQLKSLNSGVLDIIWTATTSERELQVRAIKFPLMAGMLGYRIAVYNKNVKGDFDKSTATDKFKRLIVAQGFDWPDTKILNLYNFNVQETSWYDSIYTDTAKGLYDYILRGVFEVYSEFEKYKSPQLEMDDNHLIVYPLNIYFFVAKNNQALAERIEYGLNKLDDSHNYMKLLVNYPAHKDILKSLKLSNRKIHILDESGSITEAAVRSKLIQVVQLSGQIKH